MKCQVPRDRYSFVDKFSNFVDNNIAPSADKECIKSSNTRNANKNTNDPRYQCKRSIADQTERLVGIVDSPTYEKIMPDECGPDCDGDGISDATSIAIGSSMDCDSDTVPDACEISSGAELDVDLDGVPDSCQIDCDEDGRPDAYEILRGEENDCDGNEKAVVLLSPMPNQRSK